MPEKLRIVFMGTPEFAVESLRQLIKSHHIAGIVTSPDKPAGRGKQIEMSEVKKFALENAIGPVLQPENLKSPEFLKTLSELNADLQVVVAFRMLPEAVWSMPPKGTVNLHASLLPDYRGAAPINWVIINGEKQTGITTFFIEKEIDTGKILLQERVDIHESMDAGELHDELMTKGAKLLVKTVDNIALGNINAIPQNSSGTVHQAPKIFKEDCRINWNKNAAAIYNFIRGLSPYPAAWTEISDGEKTFSLKVFRTNFETLNNTLEPGTIKSDGKNFLKVAVKDGYIDLKSIQLAGKKRMDIEEFLRGFALNGHIVLG